MSKPPEDVARALADRLHNGYLGQEHCEIEHQPFGLLRISMEFTDTDAERSKVVREIAQVARKNGYRFHTYDFSDDDVIVQEDI